MTNKDELSTYALVADQFVVYATSEIHLNARLDVMTRSKKVSINQEAIATVIASLNTISDAILNAYPE